MAGGAWPPSPAFPGALRPPWATGVAAVAAPERRALVLLGLSEHQNVYFFMARRGEEVGRRWQCDVPAGGCPCPSRRGACLFASMVRSEELFHTTWHELERFELWKQQSGNHLGCVRGPVCAGERVPACGAGSCRLAAVVSAVFMVQEVSGVRGWLSLQVRPRPWWWLVQSVRAEGWGWAVGSQAAWFGSSKSGTCLPHPRGVIHVCKLVLCSVLWKCKLICCFP